MSRLPSLNWQRVTTALERAGFVFDRQRGSHMVYYHPETNRTVVIPRHREIKVGLYAMVGMGTAGLPCYSGRGLESEQEKGTSSFVAGWKAEGLSLPLRRSRRRRIGPVGEIVNKAKYPNHVWSYDFVEDRTERGGKLRILAIIDEYTRECLAIRIAPSIPASVVIEVLEWLFLTRGVPKFTRSDNGPEFVARVVCQWLGSCGCQTLFINPGSPWENGYPSTKDESFFDKLRDECLNREVFRNGREAQAIVENWRQEYNPSKKDRSHPSFGRAGLPDTDRVCQKILRKEPGGG